MLFGKAKLCVFMSWKLGFQEVKIKWIKLLVQVTTYFEIFSVSTI